MRFATQGLHHITAIAGDAATNVAFYTGVLGLRLVKRTVNFDDRVSYHLYYGDATGQPGTLLTFFVGLPPAPARPGGGRVTCVRFAVPAGSLEYWQEHLSRHEVPVRSSGDRPALSFADPDGLSLQLVASHGNLSAPASPIAKPVEQDSAIARLDGLEMTLADPEATEAFLTERLGLAPAPSPRDTRRLAASGCEGVQVVDLCPGSCPPLHTASPGQVHHLAFRARDEAEQLAWRERTCAAGVEVTPVIDRKYFRSVYFYEPGGVRCEIATDGPGFTVDESADDLGRQLQLPEALEPQRAAFEAGLKAV